MKIKYSVTQLAKLWGISRTAVQKRIDNNKLPDGYKAEQIGLPWVITYTKNKPKTKTKCKGKAQQKQKRKK